VEACVVAEVFAAGLAVAAFTARPREPWHANAIAAGEPVDAGAGLGHRADDLVAGNDRGACVRQLAVDDMEVGAADAARVDLHQDLPRSRGRIAQFHPLEGPLRSHQDHRFHALSRSAVRVSRDPA